MKCPYCSKENILTKVDYDELNAYGKVVVNCIKCDKLFTVRDDGEGLFVG